MEKLLTIIVPVYNTEKYLPRCLNSLLVPQYMEQLEVLVIIDGSPDNSSSIAKEYQIKYPQTFIVIEKENGGHGSAINKGLEIARGKYFRVLDSDDWYDENNFINYLDRLSLETEDLILTHVIRDYPSINKYTLWINDDIKYNVKYSDLSVLNKLTSDFFAMARCTYKTSKLKKYNLFLLEHRSFEDTFLHVFPLSFINSFIFYDLVIYHYFLERPNQSVKQKVTIKQCNDWRALIEQINLFYLHHKDNLSNEKAFFVLKALKKYINTLYITINNLPYLEAKKEIRAYNSYVKSLPYYSSVKGFKLICYNAVPYMIFRAGYAVWKKLYFLFHK